MSVRVRSVSQCNKRHYQTGIAAFVIVALIGTLSVTAFSVLLDSRTINIARERSTDPVLQMARTALLGYAARDTEGYLPMPHIGTFGGAVPEGSSTPDSHWGAGGNPERVAVLGMYPWRTLGLPDLRDSSHNCLWYAVAGRFKEAPLAQPLNWDTWENDGYANPSGRLRLANSNGTMQPGLYAAFVIAPGKSLGYGTHGQNRERDTSQMNPLCQGNYEARNYLDPRNIVSAPSGFINYFQGSVNQRLAPGDSDQTFVMSSPTNNINDRILAIPAHEVFDIALKSYLPRLLNEPQFSTIAIAGNKGVDNLDCTTVSNPVFCQNWSDHMLLTALPSAAPITIDGVVTGNCSRVLIFAGRADAGQNRRLLIDRNNPLNYLDPDNVAPFNLPIANHSVFKGYSRYSIRDRTRDVIRCIP